MDDTIICRCENVYLSDILGAIEAGASSFPGIKKRVRVGMGYCQGKVCQPMVSNILLATSQRNTRPVLQRAQPPIRPVLLGDIIKK